MGKWSRVQSEISLIFLSTFIFLTVFAFRDLAYRHVLLPTEPEHVPLQSNEHTSTPASIEFSGQNEPTISNGIHSPQTTSETGIIPNSSLATLTQSRNISTSAGSIITLEAHTLQSGEIYSFDLSGYSFSSFAFQWSDGHFSYTLEPKSKQTDFTDIQITDDIQPFEKYLTSDLIDAITPEDKIIQILPKTDIPYIKIDLISTATSTIPPGYSLSAIGVYNRDAGAQYSSFPIVSRDEWGANTASWDPYSSSNIDDPSRFVWEATYHPVSRIVVHHTATANNPPDPYATVRSIYLYHAYTRGWGDIGYNYLIDQYGNVYEGKAGGDEVFGYHASTEANAMSVGISLIGTFTSIPPSAAAQNALIKLMAEKAALHGFDLKYSYGSLGEWLNTGYTVFGHRDSWFWCYPESYYFSNPYVCNYQISWAPNPTSCPGDTLRNLLASSITPQAQAYKTAYYSALARIASEVEQSSQNPHEPNTMVVGFKLPKTASESEVRSLIPSLSGISSVTVKENRAYITVLDWDNGGNVVPPAGWDGYNGPDTFFPPTRGSDDRLSTLIKIFRLDSSVEFAEFIGTRELFNIGL